MIEIEKIDPAKVVLIPNGVRIADAVVVGDVRKDLGLAADRPIFGSVSVLRPQKAIDVLLEATVIVHDRIPEAALVIVGDGPERAQLEAYTAELGIADVVTFAGMRSDVPDVLAAFDVWVSSCSLRALHSRHWRRWTPGFQ